MGDHKEDSVEADDHLLVEQGIWALLFSSIF
jgi:hypothetical protein